MSKVEYDLRYLKAGVEELEQYLLSSQLYWPVHVVTPTGETPYPRLTPGELLLAQEKLRAHSLSPGDNDEVTSPVQAKIDRLEGDFEVIRSKWRGNWGKKAAQDFSSRLALWRNFLGDYRKVPDDQAPFYAYEVRTRVILQLLEPEAVGIPAAELDMRTGLDTLLRAILVPGEFIWEAALEAGFPKADYWYLYAQPVT
ncbi:MAG: hypothetical protein MUO64_05660 [Anaerolineales bacterium]|nr:hypothetical protein [Anaerolineales bacterium]